MAKLEDATTTIRALTPLTLADGTLFPTGAVGDAPRAEAEALIKAGRAARVPDRMVEATPNPPPGA